MKKAKNLLCTILLSGILVTLPTAAFADTYHTVKKGDSLWVIAKSYGTTVAELQRQNSLKSDAIFPGQSLLIKGEVRQPVNNVSRGAGRIDTILEYAKTLMGSPYRYGGQTPQGFDCSGYIQYVLKNFGLTTPRTAAEQFNSGKKITPQEARPGDLVAFKDGASISHSGIYLGGGKFISSASSKGVSIADVYGPYWGQHFFGFSRLID
ncbi:MAG: NlpC/P60 family protein [Clostridia bacterium]|uniref:Cell wall-associated hydrolase, NlpC family n=1 Tax=Desulforamulus aeronauticus DSM 10349 TaxID=1121421 RepID=A0A1M6X7E1_9FIRM|nr:LysM peptidoglycan-binding domain-containing C40 family peptidase [Desulforamulus aeronauticus]MDA8210546.1 NlpC/P60 family protein [Clostridia bacterium]SHL01695.1 Cell wall-associated hydrolase, NlpC family [Desulforamulus aeronauticus DSM 10349]